MKIQERYQNFGLTVIDLPEIIDEENDRANLVIVDKDSRMHHFSMLLKSENNDSETYDNRYQLVVQLD